MKIREILFEDIESIIDMLQDISSFKPSKSVHKKILNNFLKQNHVNGYVFTKNNIIVGYGAIVFEKKIRGGIVGHIEDIVVKKDYRGQNIGKFIISHLIKISNNNKCYKISLVCKKNNVGFYEECGLNIDGISMSKIL